MQETRRQYKCNLLSVTVLSKPKIRQPNLRNYQRVTFRMEFRGVIDVGIPPMQTGVPRTFRTVTRAPEIRLFEIPISRLQVGRHEEFDRVIPS